MLRITRSWILLSTLLVADGWVLSALHALNRTGYALSFLLAGALFIFWERRERTLRGPSRLLWPRIKARFGRPAPLLYLGLFGLALVEGIIYPEDGSDAAMYRTPRVWHWLAEGHWHWIRTFDIRMNIANCGFEWMSAPLALFFHTDRLFFLINLISFALLPGLTFSLLRSLGVAGRVSWWWMWLLPASFCYAFQAGRLANDGCAAPYAMASVVFGLRAQKTGRVADLAIAMLGTALATGMKQTNLPLALLGLIVALPAWRIAVRRPVLVTAAGLAALVVSAIPMIVINLFHDGNWVGVPRHPGPDWTQWQNIAAASPLWSVFGNLFSLPLQTFAPPFAPFYRHWNEMITRFVHSAAGAPFSTFESFCKLAPVLDEQKAALGWGTGSLLLISLAANCRARFGHSSKETTAAAAVEGWQLAALRWAPWGLLLLFMAKVTSFEAGRQLSPYYPFLLPALLAPAANAVLVRQRWWRALAYSSMALAGAVLILQPGHPLWPAATVLRPAAQKHPFVRNLYGPAEVYERHRDFFEHQIPGDVKVVGYATGVQSLEPMLWRPFQRRVERVLPNDGLPELQARHIQYVVVEDAFIRSTAGSLEQLLKRFNGELAGQVEDYPYGYKAPPGHIYLIRLLPAGGK